MITSFASLAAVAAEGPRRGKLAQAVTDHFFGHEHLTWILPLCTMNVCPTNSGTMVQARAQVLIGSFAPIMFIFSTLA